jgi:hypothetical protein
LRVKHQKRDHRRRPGDAALADVKPWLAVLASELGELLLVPLYVSARPMVRRVEPAEAAPRGCVPPAVTVLAVLLNSEFAPTVAWP